MDAAGLRRIRFRRERARAERSLLSRSSLQGDTPKLGETLCRNGSDSITLVSITGYGSNPGAGG